MVYHTIFLFYEPILKDICNEKTDEIFRDTTPTRRNIFTSFLLKLLGRPLCLLILEKDEDHPTNLYGYNCAKNLVDGLCAVLKDPFFFLQTLEERLRFVIKHDNEEAAYAAFMKNVFLADEKISLVSVGVFYYLLFCEEMLPDCAPKIYSNTFIFESATYLVVEMLQITEPPIYEKGIKLAHGILDLLQTFEISNSSLQLYVHMNFCEKLTHIAIFSDKFLLRKTAVELLKKYIYVFDDKGRFILIKNLLSNIKHSGLLGYLITIYKDLIIEHTDRHEESADYISFEQILINPICTLSNKVETDILTDADRILSSLNFIRYFAISNIYHKVKFDSHAGQVESTFLMPLRTALDMSRAHYKLEMDRVAKGIELPPSPVSSHSANNIDLNVEVPNQIPITEISKESKLDMISKAFITFDMMESLMCRAHECIAIMNDRVSESNK